MKVTHVELAQANRFVALHHRHHKPVTGHRFSIGCHTTGRLFGVAIVGRPVARLTDQVCTLEVLRLATDGTHNACSFLYGAAARAGLALGYQKIQTFILESETGATLKAAGWTRCNLVEGRSWNTQARKGRRDDQPQCNKVRWEKLLHAQPTPPAPAGGKP